MDNLITVLTCPVKVKNKVSFFIEILLDKEKMLLTIRYRITGTKSFIVKENIDAMKVIIGNKNSNEVLFNLRKVNYIVEKLNPILKKIGVYQESVLDVIQIHIDEYYEPELIPATELNKHINTLDGIINNKVTINLAEQNLSFVASPQTDSSTMKTEYIKNHLTSNAQNEETIDSNFSQINQDLLEQLPKILVITFNNLIDWIRNSENNPGVNINDLAFTQNKSTMKDLKLLFNHELSSELIMMKNLEFVTQSLDQ